MTLADLGRAKRITRRQGQHHASSTARARRPTSRRASSSSATQIEDTTSDYDREKLQERLAKLVGGVAVIKVGAATETEMKEKKARVEDALHATRAAVEEGIVPGGGVALIRALPALDSAEVRATSSSRRQHHPPRHRGAAAPDRAATPASRARSSSTRCSDGKGAFGFNAATGEYEDLVEAGVIDPTKVVRVALQNAASVAGLMLTTEALIAERPSDGGRAGADAGGADA